MIVARTEWKGIELQMQAKEANKIYIYKKKLNYIHWLTYYTNIRINLVFFLISCAHNISYELNVSTLLVCLKRYARNTESTEARFSIIGFENFISVFILIHKHSHADTPINCKFVRLHFSLDFNWACDLSVDREKKMKAKKSECAIQRKRERAQISVG